MTKAIRFLPASLIALGVVLLLAAMLAVSGPALDASADGTGPKFTQMTNFKATGTSNGKSPCGATKSAPPPYTPAKGGAKEQCRPTAP